MLQHHCHCLAKSPLPSTSVTSRANFSGQARISLYVQPSSKSHSLRKQTNSASAMTACTSDKQQVTYRQIKNTAARTVRGTRQSTRLSLVIQQMMRMAVREVASLAAKAQRAVALQFSRQIRERRQRYCVCLEEGQQELPVRQIQAYTSLRAKSKRLQKVQSTSGAKKEMTKAGRQKNPVSNDPPITLPIFLQTSLLRGQQSMPNLWKYHSQAIPDITNLLASLRKEKPHTACTTSRNSKKPLQELAQYNPCRTGADADAKERYSYISRMMKSIVRPVKSKMWRRLVRLARRHSPATYRKHPHSESCFLWRQIQKTSNPKKTKKRMPKKIARPLFSAKWLPAPRKHSKAAMMSSTAANPKPTQTATLGKHCTTTIHRRANPNATPNPIRAMLTPFSALNLLPTPALVSSSPFIVSSSGKQSGPRELLDGQLGQQAIWQAPPKHLVCTPCCGQSSTQYLSAIGSARSLKQRKGQLELPLLVSRAQITPCESTGYWLAERWVPLWRTMAVMSMATKKRKPKTMQSTSVSLRCSQGRGSEEASAISHWCRVGLRVED